MVKGHKNIYNGLAKKMGIGKLILTKQTFKYYWQQRIIFHKHKSINLAENSF